MSDLSNQICPICNGLENIILYCDYCDNRLINGGKVSDYYDNYSPSLPEEVTSDNLETQSFCTHIFYCNNCGVDKRYAIEKKIY